MNYNQGDIVLVPFPFTMGTSSKVRPAIIVSNSKVNNTQDVILAQITSKPRRDQFSYLLENSNLSNSLNLTSQVRCHKIFVVHKTLIQKTISSLNQEGISELRTKIISFL
jgi:mRNA interferase MazF